MERELIKLKGTGDGVRIYLDADSPISDIMNSLYEKLRRFRRFFGEGHCNIYFTGRRLTTSDKMRLEAITKTMLPEGVINYGDGRRIRDEEKSEPNLEQTLELPADVKETAKTDGDNDAFKHIRDVVTANFKSSRARFYEGAVRGGKRVDSDGHLVLVGNVEEDGSLYAAGNIIVLGSLKGSVHAGCMGSDRAYVIALDMAPADIKISTGHCYYDKSSFTGGAKKAFLSDGRIMSEDFLFGSGS